MRRVTLSPMTLPTSPSGPMRILPKLNFGLSATEIVSLTRTVLGQSVKELDRIGSIPHKDCSFQNVIWPMTQIETRIHTELSSASFLQYVSTDAEVRKASVEATKLMDDYAIETGVREDLFQATKCVSENKDEMDSLDDESRRLVKKLMLGFKRNGLFLDSATREKLKLKRKRLADLQTDFSNNMNEDRTELLLTAEELKGCPQDFLEGLERRGEQYVLTTKYPDVFGVLKHAKREDVRRRMDIAFNSRCPQNRLLLEEAVQLRRDCAQILGYKNHAEAQLEENLAKSPKNVTEFEDDLRKKLRPLADKELTILRQLKKAEVGTEDIYSWDYHVI